VQSAADFGDEIRRGKGLELRGLQAAWCRCESESGFQDGDSGLTALMMFRELRGCCSVFLSRWRNRLRYVANAPRVYRNWWLWPLPKLGFDTVLRLRNGLSYAIRAGTMDLSIVNEASILNPYLGGNRITLAPDMVVMDVGAIIGDFTLQAAARCPRGRVIAVEPVTEHVEALKRNIELNGFSNIEVLQLALGDGEGQSEIHVAGLASSGTFARPGTRSEMVRKASLSTLMKELAIERLDLLNSIAKERNGRFLPALTTCSQESARFAWSIILMASGPVTSWPGCSARTATRSPSPRSPSARAAGPGCCGRSGAKMTPDHPSRAADRNHHHSSSERACNSAFLGAVNMNFGIHTGMTESARRRRTISRVLTAHQHVGIENLFGTAPVLIF